MSKSNSSVVIAAYLTPLRPRGFVAILRLEPGSER
jgi:hypothetical protein